MVEAKPAKPKLASVPAKCAAFPTDFAHDWTKGSINVFDLGCWHKAATLLPLTGAAGKKRNTKSWDSWRDSPQVGARRALRSLHERLKHQPCHVASLICGKAANFALKHAKFAMSLKDWHQHPPRWMSALDRHTEIYQQVEKSWTFQVQHIMLFKLYIIHIINVLANVYPCIVTLHDDMVPVLVFHVFVPWLPVSQKCSLEDVQFAK